MTMRWLTTVVLATSLATPATAAKWEGGCPKLPRFKLYKVGRDLGGGTPLSEKTKFQHVGHEVTYRLSDKDVLYSGGFSTEPDGNTVQVTFWPTKLTPITLPPIPVTATSPSTLTVVVPDSRPYLGRLLVGRADMVVSRGSQAMFLTRTVLVLPPMNDVRELVNDGYEVEALGMMDTGPRIWIPLSFRGFGGGEPGLPECPTELTPVTPFAIELSLKKGEDQTLPYLSFGQLKSNTLLLGDYLQFGNNFYGAKLRTKLDVSPLAGKGIIMCSKNDALELVLMVKLQNPALGEKSELAALMEQGAPIPVKIHNISTDPDVAEVLASVEYDATKKPCYPEL